MSTLQQFIEDNGHLVRTIAVQNGLTDENALSVLAISLDYDARVRAAESTDLTNLLTRIINEDDSEGEDAA